jgi:hypothetical protein
VPREKAVPVLGHSLDRMHEYLSGPADEPDPYRLAAQNAAAPSRWSPPGSGLLESRANPPPDERVQSQLPICSTSIDRVSPSLLCEHISQVLRVSGE